MSAQFDPVVNDTLRAMEEERKSWLHWKPFRAIAEMLPKLPERPTKVISCDQAVVAIGEDLAVDDPLRLATTEAAQACMPWKKGPFKLWGTPIDAEWRSDFKWDRFAHRLPDLTDHMILDVGCNNGYYMFRTLPSKPRFVLGIDPVPRLWYQFNLLQKYAGLPNLDFRMWGWEEVAHFEQVFDTIFCMGIVYHHFNPIQILKHLYSALKPGGLLVLESIVVPGETSTCLFPADRYARMRNVWFVPTVQAMVHFMERTRFENVEVIAVNKHEPAEQRTTPWNPGPSYENFIQEDHPELTVEGLPAPYRAVLFARKKG